MVAFTRAEVSLSTPHALIEVTAKYQVPGDKPGITHVGRLAASMQAVSEHW